MSVHLVDVPLVPVDATVIERLEEVLAQAREGQISAVVIATVHRDGMTGHAWSEQNNMSLMIGALERAKFSMLGCDQ